MTRVALGNGLALEVILPDFARVLGRLSNPANYPAVAYNFAHNVVPKWNLGTRVTDINDPKDEAKKELITQWPSAMQLVYFLKPLTISLSALACCGIRKAERINGQALRV